MNKDQAWRRVCEIEQAIKQELASCRAAKKNPNESKAYQNLKKDAAKAQEEYRKLSGQGTTAFNPLSIEHGEQMQRNQVFGRTLGRSGPDSHYTLKDKHDK
jgi:hypothetical protein